MSETRFYICEHCGNIVGKIHDAGVSLVCCGQEMKPLVPGTVEASAEKHIPVVTVENGLVKVTVGAAEHPMTDAHLIQWVYLQTASGGQRKVLAPGAAPSVAFALTEDEKPVAVYAYCNLHGLWMAEI
ncbi:MAG: desulfoferrodoxin family protein [Oscillospiraceae bacterium]